MQAIDLLGRLAMGIGLVRAKIVSKSGRAAIKRSTRSGTPMSNSSPSGTV